MLRRTFIQTCGLGAVGLTSVGALAKTKLLKTAGVAPRGSAENLILIFLQGAPSHLDTFDLKTGSWTPDDFEPVDLGNFQMAAGLFPNLINQADKFSLLRSISGFEAVHQRASYLFETAHTFNPVFAKEQPHIGSLIAYELGGQRKETDIFPTFLSLNGQPQGPGMLASEFAPFSFRPVEGVNGLEHRGGEALFNKRYQSLLALDQQNRFQGSSNGSAITDYHNFYKLAERLMYAPDAEEAFTATEADLARYGETDTGAACAAAVKTLAKNRGARVVQITQGGWDMHYDIYNRNDPGSIYNATAELDQALAAMLEDLAATPGKRGGTLLDETLVVATGEFGRTPGALSGNAGRDHYPYAWSALMAGGGVVPGQAFGATNADGATIIDPFWSGNRYIAIQDVIATIYSSLGIDWTKEIQETPSGRVYEYTPKENGQAGYYTDIVEVFG